jgi:hypothetical protein
VLPCPRSDRSVLVAFFSFWGEELFPAIVTPTRPTNTVTNATHNVLLFYYFSDPPTFLSQIAQKLVMITAVSPEARRRQHAVNKGTRLEKPSGGHGNRHSSDLVYTSPIRAYCPNKAARITSLIISQLRRFQYPLTRRRNLSRRQATAPTAPNDQKRASCHCNKRHRQSSAITRDRHPNDSAQKRSFLRATIQA